MVSSQPVDSEPLNERSGYRGIHRKAPLAPHHILLGKAIIGSTLHAEVEKRVEIQPDRIALQDSEYCFTYKQLDQEADRIAHAVRTALIVRHGEDALQEQRAVSLLFGFSVYSAVAMLGVLKAGMFFLAMDPTHPQARNTFMLGDSGSEILLTREKFLPQAEELVSDVARSGGFQNVDRRPEIITVEKLKISTAITAVRHKAPVPSSAICDLVYTSGSTGQPKGVIDTHANILQNTWHISQYAHYGPGESHAKLNSVVSAGAIVRIFTLLICGASLHLYNIKENGVMGFPEWLREHQITAFNAQPPLFRFICHALLDKAESGDNPFPNLRLVSVGGDKARQSDIDLFKRCFPPGVTLRHGGGSTEAGPIAESYLNHDSQIGEFGVPWGYPVDDRQIFIWDENGVAMPTGEVGEIVVKSKYISPGYWRRPELTREVFLPDPQGGEERLYRTGDLGRLLPSGLLVHEGRADFMLKVLSYRVEPGEVEAALLSYPGVQQAAVVGRGTSSDEVQLVAYVLPSTNAQPSMSKLRDYLEGKLPNYMIPARILILDDLPLTVTGKIDRLALPEPLPTRPELDTPYIEARSELEKRLAEVWSQVLDVKPVGIRDEFLSLGGSSLDAMRVVHQLNSLFPLRITLRDLFSTYTIEQLAEVIENKLD
jgi:amino acid adenylation domain-containing protein